MKSIMKNASVKHPPGTLARGDRKIWPRPAAALTALAATAMLSAGLAGPALAQASTASLRPGVTGHDVSVNGPSAKAAARIAGYWTRSRMLSARSADTLTIKPGTRAPKLAPHPSGPAGEVAGTAPAQPPGGGIRPVPGVGHLRPLAGSSGSPWTGSFYQPPATTSGKVFFTTTAGGQTQNWVCSGSTVNSNGKNVVFTAGHCVYGSIGGKVPGEGWHSNWVFVPDYYYGYAPYGVWKARQLWTLTNYANTGGSLSDEGDDIGAAVMNTNGYGQHIVNVAGGQGIRWNYPDTEYVYDFRLPGRVAVQRLDPGLLQRLRVQLVTVRSQHHGAGLQLHRRVPAAARGWPSSTASSGTSTGSMTSPRCPETSSPATSATTRPTCTARSPTYSQPDPCWGRTLTPSPARHKALASATGVCASPQTSRLTRKCQPAPAVLPPVRCGFPRARLPRRSVSDLRKWSESP